MTATDGQTFSAAKTGSLDRVAVYRRFGRAAATGKIFLDIYSTNAEVSR